MRQSHFFCLLYLFIPAFLNHCGYHLTPKLKKDFGSQRGIFVPVFENNTDETGAERVFTDAVIHELQSRHLVILSSRKKGALELKGSIQSITYFATALTVPGYLGLQSYRRVPQEIGIQVVLQMTLEDPQTKKILWQSTFPDFRRVYGNTNRTFAYQGSSQLGMIDLTLVYQTFPQIAGDIVRDLYDRMMDVLEEPAVPISNM